MILSELTELNDNICLSGGADGADCQWGMMAGKLGHSVIHWSFAGHKSNAPINEIVRLTEEQLKTADSFLIRANQIVKRKFPTYNEYTNNLLRRNWYQVSQADSLYAVSTMDTNKMVSGGTFWAIAMYMDRFIHDGEDIEKCNLYLYDQNMRVWWTWKNTWTILQGEPPQPSGIWAGIGSRNLNIDGKWTIRKLMGGYEVGEEQISSIFPLVEEPKIGDVVYVPDIKIEGKGIDDVIGGWAKVQNVQQGVKDTFVSMVEFSDRFLKWDNLKVQQAELRHKYGLQHAQLKPDESKEHNSITESYRIK